MNTNTADNNKRIFTVSDTTDTMLRLMQDFRHIQNQVIALYEGKACGEDVINATVAVYHAMEAAVIANISVVLEESEGKQI